MSKYNYVTQSSLILCKKRRRGKELTFFSLLYMRRTVGLKPFFYLYICIKFGSTQFSGNSSLLRGEETKKIRGQRTRRELWVCESTSLKRINYLNFLPSPVSIDRGEKGKENSRRYAFKCRRRPEESPMSRSEVHPSSRKQTWRHWTLRRHQYTLYTWGDLFSFLISFRD